MGLLSNLWRKTASLLHFDALYQTGRARKIRVSPQVEDRYLTSHDRLSIKTQTRDLLQNFSIAGFAIRKHIQYMSEFRFSSELEDQALNTRIEAAFESWANDPDRCHSSKRHDFKTLINLIELHRVLDGDIGIVRLSNGTIQLIESDRIRNEVGDLDPTMIQGVEIGPWNENISYRIYKRGLYGSAYEYERTVPASNFDLVGYYDRSDQVRGISPLTSSIREFSHLYEGIDFALAKMKIEQLFGLVTFRDKSVDAIGKVEVDQAGKIVEKFGDSNLFHLDLGLDDKADFMTGSTPSTNFQTFTEQIIRSSFASLDIPFSFYDGSKTNFYGSKGELNHYINGCKIRQRGLLIFLNRITKWILSSLILSGDLKLPIGMELSDIKYKWIGAGIPYWRLIDDSKGYQVAIQNGFTNPETVCAEHQLDFYDNIDRTVACCKYAREKGFILPYDPESTSKTNIGL